MNFKCGNLYHVYNQGNNKQTLFKTDEEYSCFLNLIRTNIFPYCEIIAYCLMPNHFHFMLYMDERVQLKRKIGNIFMDPITNGFRKTLSSFARIMNNKYNRTGSLFRQKTKSKCLSEIDNGILNISYADYVYCFFHDIHQNPLKAGLVKDLKDWLFSSYPFYAGLVPNSFVNKNFAVQFCGYNPIDFQEKTKKNVPEIIIGLLKKENND